MRISGTLLMRRNPFWSGLALLPFVVSSALAQEEIVATTPAGTRHEMVLVLAETFAMGSASGKSDEAPVHPVYLDAYYIDKFEVTNAHYVGFLNAIGRNADARGYQLVDLSDLDAQIQRSGDAFALKLPSCAALPVVEVSWYGARAYCEWAGLHLPTEAEWEKAARGTDGRTYPWGEEIDRSRANYGAERCCRGDDRDGYFAAAPVGSYPGGVSPYGAYDMAGNVWELVMDWYSADYYASVEAGHNPTGPASGAFRVIRGGSWSSRSFRLRTSERGGNIPELTYVLIGFRCAGDGRAVPSTGIAPQSWGRVKSQVKEE